MSREAGRSKRTLVVPNGIYSKTDPISWGQLSHTYSTATTTATILLETKLDNTLMACTSGRSLPTGADALSPPDRNGNRSIRMRRNECVRVRVCDTMSTTMPNDGDDAFMPNPPPSDVQCNRLCVYQCSMLSIDVQILSYTVLNFRQSRILIMNRIM